MLLFGVVGGGRGAHKRLSQDAMCVVLYGVGGA